MSEQLLEILKLCLLGLLYLFLLRVVWAVVAQLRTPATAAVAAAPSAAPRTAPAPAKGRKARSVAVRRLVIRAPAERKGTTYDLADGLSIGRAPGHTITLDDTFVSQNHARIVHRDCTWWFEDLRSTNGSLHNGTRVTSAVQLTKGDTIQLGDTILELQ